MKAENPTDGPLWKITHDPTQPYITGTSVAELIGVGYNSRPKYWRNVAGIDSPSEHSPFTLQLFQHGHDNEPRAIDCMKRVLSKHGDWVFACPGTLVDPEDPFFLVSMDFNAVCARTGKIVNIEIKCPMSRLPGGLHEVRSNSAAGIVGRAGVKNGRVCQVLMQMRATRGAIRTSILFHWLSDTEWEAYLFLYCPWLADLLFEHARQIKTALMSGRHDWLAENWQHKKAFYDKLLNDYKSNTHYCLPLSSFPAISESK